jgi:hypothetical protein
MSTKDSLIKLSKKITETAGNCQGQNKKQEIEKMELSLWRQALTINVSKLNYFVRGRGGVVKW